MEIDIEKLLDKFDKTVIDIRPEHEFIRGNIPESVNIAEDKIFERIKEFDKSKGICLVCATGNKTEYLTEELESLGYENIYNLRGGYEAYMKFKLNEFLKNESEKSGDINKAKDIERSIIKKFRKSIWRKFTAAVNEYELIKDGDKIAVCISGGKDSMLMAKLFQELLRHGKKNFTLVFLVMNPGYDDINYQTILDNAKLLDVPITVFESSIYDIVAEDEKSPCYLCARMRRGSLYAKAKELGCNKLALGHHFNDVIETTMLNLLCAGSFKTMPPKLKAKNFEDMEIIRPLYLIEEEYIIRWMKSTGLMPLNCACMVAAKKIGNKRYQIKDLIENLKKDFKNVDSSIFRAAENVNINLLLGYEINGHKVDFNEKYENDNPFYE